jgi:arylsulfatase A
MGMKHTTDRRHEPSAPYQSRRTFLHTAGLGVSSLAVSSLLPNCAKVSDRPNIILIMADDLGYECLGCNGGTSYATPHLDELARTGVRFTHAYAQPLCTPTRLQIMTGKYNFRNWKAFGIMDPGESTFGHILQDAGYKTCISGKWQLYSYNPPDFQPEWRSTGMRPEEAGFDEYCLFHTEHTENKGSRYADPVIQQNGTYLQNTAGWYGPDICCDYVNSFIERNRHDRFFIYYPMCLPHGPFEPTPDSADWQVDRHRRDAKYFPDMVEYMDKLVGRITKKLDELDLRKETLILFYSDNGTPRQIQSYMGNQVVWGGKGTFRDEGTHVPLIANWQGMTPSGTVCDDLIDSTDFLPTVSETAGASLPEDDIYDGRSFLSQIRGETGNAREWVLVHHDPTPGWDKEGYFLRRFARDKQFKLYADGQLFDMHQYSYKDTPLDRNEREDNPLKPDEGGPEAEAARKKLQQVLA